MILSPQGSTSYFKGTPDSGCLFVFICYVDGTSVSVPVEDWDKVRSDGVDYIEIDNISISSASAYWIYPEAGKWVVGWGSFRYDPNPLTEIVLDKDGQTERKIQFAPDLRHSQIKLGWWWPGKDRPNG